MKPIHCSRLLVAILFQLVVSPSAFAQSPSIQWQHIYGSLDTDMNHGAAIYGDHFLTSTSDGGAIFLTVSWINSNGITGVHEGLGAYILVVKINAEGTIQWQKPYGGMSGDEGTSIQQTSDGGYIFSGVTFSRDGDVGAAFDSNVTPLDGWIVKINDTGTIQWQRRVGGRKDDQLSSVSETSDHGFIAAGNSFSSGNEGWYNHGGEDAYVVRLDSNGNLLWQYSFGGSLTDEARSIASLPDGGYIFTGWTMSFDGDVKDNKHNGAALWIVRLNKYGQIVWQHCYGGTNASEGGNAILATVGGGFIVAGYSYTNNGDVTGHHGDRLSEDLWLLKIDSLGSIEWQKSLGGSDKDNPLSITGTKDSGYVITGYTWSNDIGMGLPPVHGKRDAWVCKLTVDGTVEWMKLLGGTDDEVGFCTIETKDGYLVYSSSKSVDGDLLGQPIGDKPWLVKLSHESGIESSANGAYFKHPYPNPSSQEIRLELSHSQRFKQLIIVGTNGREYHPDYRIESTTAIIDLRTLPTGAYMAQIEYLDKETVEDIRKFVRE